MADLPDVLYERLAKVGLVEQRGRGRSATLGDWCDKYLLQRTDLAERSTEKLDLSARRMKEFFGEAMERDMIPANPFKKLKSASIAANRDRYVTPEEADRILETCPDYQWRLLFGLMRFGG